MSVLHRRIDRIQTHRYSLSVTTPTISYSDNAEWILDTGATYHVCPNMDRFSSFEKLDGCFTVIGDDHPCNVEGMGTNYINMDDRIVRELKEMMYVSQLKRNFISIGALEALSRMISIRDGVLKMIKGSILVMKGVRLNNLYYLKDSIVTGQVEILFLQMMITHKSGR